MECPHCRQEHAEDERVCPNTGLPLENQVVCLNCGRVARPGASYCAACGAILPRTPPTIQQEPTISTSGDSEAIPAGSQNLTRPSVSLVELSRRKTQAYRIEMPTSPRAIQQWARQSRLWNVIGYTLLILVLLAGAAGLYIIWGQLR
jgi:hypothetical protein